MVEVKEVFWSPPSVPDFRGADVTLLVASVEGAARGQQALFFAEGWLYGESLALQEVARRKPVDPDDVRRLIERGPPSKR